MSTECERVFSSTKKAAYTREESACGGHRRGMRRSKGLVEEGTYSITEGLGRQ
jgi:hypothetical protein